MPILVVAVVQGWCLYALHYSLDEKTWPATDAGWLLALYAIALFLPAALELLASELRSRIVWLVAVAIAALGAALGGYAGWTLESVAAFGFGGIVALYGALFGGWFIGLPFVQARLRSGRWNASYADLFEFAWQNALVLLEAAVFLGVFWLILLLWQGLFAVIGVTFFRELFRQPSFAYPVSAIAFGYAVYLIESNEKIVATVRRHLLGVFGWLLPLVALIAVLFLAALPFTGLAPLWKTGHATALMLWLQLFFVHFLNSAYQDGQAEPRYPSWLKQALRVCVFALPVYALLCAYSLGLRVEQHGWTISRVWAAIATALAAMYGVTYAAAALHRGRWLAPLGRANLGLALAFAVVLLLTATPFLDPRRLSTQSQLARLRSGTVAAEKFDYDYLRFELGRFGRQALADLAKGADATIARYAAASLAKKSRYAQWANVAPDAIASRIDVLPAGAALDPAFLEYLKGVISERPHDHPGCLRTMTPKPCLFFAVDLNADGAVEYVALNSYPQVVYGRQAGKWSKVGDVAPPGYVAKSVEEAIRTGQVKVERHGWDDVVIGGARYMVRPLR